MGLQRRRRIAATAVMKPPRSPRHGLEASSSADALRPLPTHLTLVLLPQLQSELIVGRSLGSERESILVDEMMLRRISSSLSPWISSPSNSLLHQNKIPSGLMFVELFMTEIVKLAKVGDASNLRPSFITFVLGGPGSGKGTQCEKIAETFGFAHFSAGDLLRREMLSDSKNGVMIRDAIKEGRIVPSEVTVKIIRNAIESCENHKILIDGFPRTDENRSAFERIVGVEPDLVVFFDCPEEEEVKRVLSRNQGRIDDNIETLKKRLKVFNKFNLPVIDYYSRKGKVHTIRAVGTVEEVFEKVRPIFAAVR